MEPALIFTTASVVISKLHHPAHAMSSLMEHLMSIGFLLKSLLPHGTSSQVLTLLTPVAHHQHQAHMEPQTVHQHHLLLLHHPVAQAAVPVVTDLQAHQLKHHHQTDLEAANHLVPLPVRPQTQCPHFTLQTLICWTSTATADSRFKLRIKTPATPTRSKFSRTTHSLHRLVLLFQQSLHLECSEMNLRQLYKLKLVLNHS